jgi:putative oxidoreductase
MDELQNMDTNHERSVVYDRPAVDVSLLVLRVIVGVIFAAHGAQKMFGVWGGAGLEATVQQLGSPIGYLVAIGEFFGGLGLVFGFLTRFSAASLIVIMIGAIVKVHGQNGFFLRDQGYEYNLALIGLLLPVLIAGPGRFSIGHYLPLPKSAHTGRPVVLLE